MKLGMLGKTETNNVYALFRRDGFTDWDYLLISENDWDNFCNEKDAAVDSDRMRNFIEQRLKKEIDEIKQNGDKYEL